MASKESIRFLESASQQQILEKKITDKFINFAKSNKYQQEGWFSLSRSIGALGAITLSFGLILLIFANWYNLSDLIKILIFISLLGGSHFGGLFLASKNYSNSASFLHFLGAILVITGIILIEEIFHLNTPIKTALLIWMIAIIPIGILLKNGPIILVSTVLFNLWSNFQLSEVVYTHILELVLFNTSFAISTFLIGTILKQHNNSIAPYLQVPAIIFVIFWLYCLGFTHNFSLFHFKAIKITFPLLALIPGILINIYLWITKHHSKEKCCFILSLAGAIVTVIIALFVFANPDDNQYFYEFNNFNKAKKIYIMPLLVSISAWIAYFSLASWGVAYGAVNHGKALLDISIFLIGVGIFTRFIDLVGNMVNTRAAFIICGASFFIIGFILGKWRKKLIQSSTINT